MRARNIKPGFFDNEELGGASIAAHLLFAGLFMLADREGRLEDRPARIKAKIFPYRDVDINGELTVLERLGFICRYRVGDFTVIQVVNFKKHQSPHHTERPSDLPKLPADYKREITVKEKKTVKSPYRDGEYRPDSLIPDSLIQEEETSSSKTVKRVYPEDFEKFWQQWPAARRKEKPDAYVAWRNALKRATVDELMTGLSGYLRSKQVREGFAPYPAKWLKKDRWAEDHSDSTGIVDNGKLSSAELEKIYELNPEMKAHDEEVRRQREAGGKA